MPLSLNLLHLWLPLSHLLWNNNVCNENTNWTKNQTQDPCNSIPLSNPAWCPRSIQLNLLSNYAGNCAWNNTFIKLIKICPIFLNDRVSIPQYGATRHHPCSLSESCGTDREFHSARVTCCDTYLNRTTPGVYLQIRTQTYNTSFRFQVNFSVFLKRKFELPNYIFDNFDNMLIYQPVCH